MKWRPFLSDHYLLSKITVAPWYDCQFITYKFSIIIREYYYYLIIEQIYIWCGIWNIFMCHVCRSGWSRGCVQVCFVSLCFCQWHKYEQRRGEKLQLWSCFFWFTLQIGMLTVFLFSLYNIYCKIYLTLNAFLIIYFSNKPLNLVNNVRKINNINLQESAVSNPHCLHCSASKKQNTKIHSNYLT